MRSKACRCRVRIPPVRSHAFHACGSAAQAAVTTAKLSTFVLCIRFIAVRGLQVKTSAEVVEDPSQLARAAKDLIIAQETEAESQKRLMQMMRDLTSADRCAWRCMHAGDVRARIVLTLADVRAF